MSTFLRAFRINCQKKWVERHPNQQNVESSFCPLPAHSMKIQCNLPLFTSSCCRGLRSSKETESTVQLVALRRLGAGPLSRTVSLAQKHPSPSRLRTKRALFWAYESRMSHEVGRWLWRQDGVLERCPYTSLTPPPRSNPPPDNCPCGVGVRHGLATPRQDAPSQKKCDIFVYINAFDNMFDSRKFLLD